MAFACDEFYRRNAQRYAAVAGSSMQSTAIDSSHPRLTGDWDLIERLMELAPGPRGLDAGCGAGARDVRRLLERGFDMTGIDSVREVVRVTHATYPELEQRVLAADLRRPLPFVDGAFDFALSVSVIQHLEKQIVQQVTLPELTRVLRPGGVLLLAFKKGSGTVSVYDRHYEEERHFLLHDEHEVLETLRSCGMQLVHGRSSDQLGGLMYCTDVKGIRYCALFAAKQG
jgi:SAM-dependent methyltransferase